MYHESMLPTTIVRRNDDIIAAGLADATILLNATTWTYANFNETAARIWETLDAPRSIDALVSALMDGYDVDRGTCEREVVAFVDEMSKRGFIVVS